MVFKKKYLKHNRTFDHAIEYKHFKNSNKIESFNLKHNDIQSVFIYKTVFLRVYNLVNYL